MRELIATYKIVTPMFIGGADQSPADGIRPPSVKGALRFWWRALNWGRFWEDVKDEEQALQHLHREEARLFGAAMGDKENVGGQGCFLLSVHSKKLSVTEKEGVHQQFKNNNASRYLAYGLMAAFGTDAGKLVRGCINENQYFDVKLVFKHDIDTSIKEAVIALGLLGGLGSRNRHGLGSLSLDNLTEEGHNIWDKAENKEIYAQQVKGLLENKLSANNPAPYTCFDNKSRIEKLDTNNDPYKSLNKFGEAILMYRSWGKDKTVLRKESEMNFEDDHDWSKSNLRSKLPGDFHPKRAVFGLPHNYGKGSSQSVTPAVHERRSSPLFIHVHQLNEKSFLTLSIFFPSLFLPEGEKINAGGKIVENKANYEHITNFLDGDCKKGGKRFPNRESIFKGNRV